MSNKKLKIQKYCIYAILIGSGNILFSGNYSLGVTFSIFQMLVVFSMLFIRKINESICYMMISVVLGLSYDMGMGQFNGQWYTLKTIKLLGINLGFWIVIPFFLMAIFRKDIWKSLFIKKGKILTKVVRSILFLNVCSLFVGFINVFLLNDNNVKTMPNYLSAFTGLIYIPILVTLMPLLIFYWRITTDSKFKNDLEMALKSVFLGVVISVLTSLLTGNTGEKMDTTVVWASVVGAFLPYVIIFPFYKETKNKIKSFLLGVISLFVGIYFFANGKMMLTFFLLIIILIGLLLERRNHPWILFFSVGALIGATLLYFNVLSFATTRIIQSKSEYAISLLRVFDDNWWNLIPPSPKWRLVEFINISKEYFSKPYMALFGKGILGTVPDYTGYLSNFYGSVASSKMEEWITGLFYSMHETINVLYLQNGLIGLFQLAWILKLMLRHYKVSPFIVIGCFWYALYYGYSYTIAVFGCAALVFGFYEVQNYMEV